MSTDRAGFSEQTPSSRPAARLQSAIASEPMIRRRYATPTIDAARSAMAAVVVASKARISSSSFGRCVSRTPSRNAPSPRVAVHSSPVPKSWT